MHKKPITRKDKTAVAVVRTNSHCKQEKVGHVRQNIAMIAKIFLSLPYCTLDIFAAGKYINRGG